MHVYINVYHEKMLLHKAYSLATCLTILLSHLHETLCKTLSSVTSPETNIAVTVEKSTT